jgi:23S rRNA (uracil1939-C5)-methyltransferase
MSLSVGQEIELGIDKPAAGGRMIGRHEGQVLLVHGAIPGERVLARIDRLEKRLAFASVAQVIDSSADRRESGVDPLCGGCVYAHIAYPRQVLLKGEVIADAFVRIGRVPLANAVTVAPSPEQAYRMRARLHVRGGRAGFYREGTHQLCDAAPTAQLLPDTPGVIAAALAVLNRGPAGADNEGRIAAVEVSENVAGNERALHFELVPGVAVSGNELTAVVEASGITGCTARSADHVLTSAGDPRVSDPLVVLTGGRALEGVLSRSPESFFQANRYLLASLVTAVLDAVPAEGDVLDLYAGVGLFSIALAAIGREGITAVEGARSSGTDLKRNAAPFSDRVRFVLDAVERHLARRRAERGTIMIVDPPRTGISRDAMQAITRYGAARIAYVSCDPPTMARDARRLLDSGYGLTSLQGFDLFPNTPHVEVLGVFENRS